MKFPVNKLPLFRSLLALLLVLVCLTAQVLGAQFDEIVVLPEEYGKIIYQTDTGAPARIYIIANSHRSAFSGNSANETLQSQIETYRIGEWLISQEKVGLLFPEGFFGSWEKKSLPTERSDALDDNVALKQRLSDTSTFVNAEILLHEVHGIELEQVEDRPIYLQVRKLLNSRLNENVQSADADIDIESLQQLRTAAILQQSISALGSASHRGAMLTIGFSHLAHIITYLETGKALENVLDSDAENLSAFQPKVDPPGIPVDISVIVPRVLLSKPLLALNERR